jgi:hypothetical protein
MRESVNYGDWNVMYILLDVFVFLHNQNALLSSPREISTLPLTPALISIGQPIRIA